MALGSAALLAIMVYFLVSSLAMIWGNWRIERRNKKEGY